MGRKKATQEELPGMEARDVPEIEQAAENYRKIRDERCELSKRESEAKSALIQVMKNLGRSFYSYNGLKVQLEITDNVKVKSSEGDDDEPIGTFKTPKKAEYGSAEDRENWVKEQMKQEEDLIEQQQQAEIDDTERERLHRDAVANWKRERPASVEDEAVRDAKKFSEIMGEEGPDSDAEWFASLTVEEREKYYAAPCKCGHSRDWHGEEDKDICERECGACANLSLCKQYHCPVCDTKGGHQATCEHYILGEGTPLQPEGDSEAWTIPATIKQALHAALHHVEGAAERWRPLQDNGATDDGLKAMIGREFGIGGGSTDYEGYRFKGGKSPEFSWPGYADQSQAQTYKGKRLLAKVRDVMEIGAPGQSSQADNLPSAMDVVKAACTGTFKGGHQVRSAHPLKGQEADDFTAPRCDECKRTDGAHTKECSKNPARLTSDDYLAYAQAHYKTNHQSHARKMALTGVKDDEIRAWKREQQQAGNGAEAEPTKSAKLSPVEAAIDR